MFVESRSLFSRLFHKVLKNISAVKHFKSHFMFITTKFNSFVFSFATMAKGKIVSLNGYRRGPSTSLKKSEMKRKKNAKKTPFNTLQLLFENVTKRPIFVDGCNVGFTYTQHSGFSVEGLENCLNTLARLGHTAVAVVPQNKLSDRLTSNPSLLRKLENEDRLIFTPFNNKYGECNASYDDRCTLDLAVRHDAAIITNDQFRDLIKEKREWRDVIENRVISFTYFKDMLILPDDPYGSNGPKLSQILNK